MLREKNGVCCMECKRHVNMLYVKCEIFRYLFPVGKIQGF